MRKELLKVLTEEQSAKIKECKSQEEVLKFAKEEGIELTDEQLEAVSGGCGTTPPCPDCGSTNVERKQCYYVVNYKCRNCGHTW